MYWLTGLVVVALTFGQVPAGLVEPGVFAEDALTEVKPASSRITSGWEAYPGQFPYVAALRLFMLAGGVGDCIGSIVHQNWVISTATCVVRPFAVVVRAGVTDLTTTPEYIFETREWWIHPSFNVSVLSSLQQNNICILRVQRPFIYGKLVQPIRIQTLVETVADYADEKVIASGWGRVWSNGVYPTVLNWVYLRALSQRECRMNYASISDTQICTRGYNDSTQSTCTNDNGSPLVHESRDGEPVLVGLAAHLPCNSGSAAVFTRPGPFHGWLTDVTGIDFENKEDEVTEATAPPTTETTEPPATEATELPTTEVTRPPNTATPEPPTTEATEPPTTEVIESPTTEVTRPPITATPEPPTTEVTEPSSEESDKDSNESDSSESEEDPQISELLNKLQMKVKVKVSVGNKIKKKVKVK